MLRRSPGSTTRGSTFVSATGARLALEWSATVVDEEVTRGVTEWLGVATALGPTVAGTAATEGGASYVVTLPDGPASAVHDAYDTVAALTEPDTRGRSSPPSVSSPSTCRIRCFPTRGS